MKCNAFFWCVLNRYYICCSLPMVFISSLPPPPGTTFDYVTFTGTSHGEALLVMATELVVYVGMHMQNCFNPFPVVSFSTVGSPIFQGTVWSSINFLLNDCGSSSQPNLGQQGLNHSLLSTEVSTCYRNFWV